MHTLQPNTNKDVNLTKFVDKIEAMPKLTHLRLGNWKHDMSTAAQRTPQGDITRAYIFERRTVKVLRKLFPHLVIHLDPHLQGDGRTFFRTHGHPEPNPDYPHESDPSYIFNTLGRSRMVIGKAHDWEPNSRTPRKQTERGYTSREYHPSMPLKDAARFTNSRLTGKIL